MLQLIQSSISLTCGCFLEKIINLDEINHLNWSVIKIKKKQSMNFLRSHLIMNAPRLSVDHFKSSLLGGCATSLWNREKHCIMYLNIYYISKSHSRLLRYLLCNLKLFFSNSSLDQIKNLISFNFLTIQVQRLVDWMLQCHVTK